MSKKISTNIFFNVLLTISQVAFPIITVPYLSRILQPSGLGVVNFIDNITQYLLFICALGIPVYGMREISKHKSDINYINKIFSEFILINLIVSVVVAVTYFIVIEYYLKTGYRSLYYYGCLIMLINVFTIDWLYQGLEQFPFVTTRNIAVKSIIVILTFLLVKSKNNLNYYYILLTTSYLINAIINMVHAYRKHNIRIRFSLVSLQSIKKHLKPIFYIFSANLAISLFLYLDSFILGLLKNYTAVGYYSIATKIVKLPAIAIQAVIMVFVPRISFEYKNNNLVEVEFLIQRSLEFVALISVPLCIGLFCYSGVLVHLFAGNQYTNCVFPLRLMCPIIFFLSLTNIFIWEILTPFGKEKFFLFTVCIAMLVSITINLTLIPHFSYNGTALATLCTEFTVCLFAFLFSRKVFPVKLNIKKFLQSAAASLCFFPVYYATQLLFNQNIIAEIGSITVCILIYFSIYRYVYKSRVIKELFLFIKSK